MSQSQPLRIEHPDFGSFATVRTVNSQLLFVNNPDLEDRVLGRLAQYQEKYEVELYAFVIMGNHYHPLTKFPKCNRAHFFRDLNARTAEAVRKLVPEFKGGPLVERRYSEQALPLDEDIENQFFYSALQPVSSGLAEKISDYPGYNSFDDAITGRTRKIRQVNWAAYNQAKRKGRRPRICDFYYYVELKYKRLPGYEDLSQKEYRKLMLQKFEQRRQVILEEFAKQGYVFPTPEQLRRTKASAYPKHTKKSERHSKRPLVLSRCAKAKKAYLELYFSIYHAYKEACRRYRAGDFGVEFPPRTYRPPGVAIYIH